MTYKKYLDENISDEERVEDLVSRMTLEEKTTQLRHNAPAVKRLGIPFYNWWNEALHGVARAGAATVFPQPIGLAASFDDTFLMEIGDIVATEGRAKYNEQIRKNDRGLYKGLTFWSPNINLFRDPRWGRGHETYGEDPYLTSRMGVAYIKGLQGTRKRLKSAACIKHFAAHSGPEKGRHSFDSVVSKKDLAESYLPAFEACVKEGKVEGVMGGYNRINGEPACGSYHFIQELLREKWGFDGYYVSDCGAIKDFHMHHMVTRNAMESGTLALKSGCDLNCGAVYLHIMQAYENGLLTEEDIDKGVMHVMKTRMRLGMFDRETEYDQISYEENDTREHHKKALRAAEESMVLLKNDNILPLDKKKIKAVAVIGPNADSREVLKGNYNGTATETYTFLEGIRRELGEEARIYYSEGCHLYRENVEALAEADDRISEAVSMAERSDIIFLCVGLDARLEGEEGDANNSYAGADKVDLEFPESQKRLMEAVCAVGKPVILLNSTGSAMNLSYAQKYAKAILQTWYPGQMGGIAAANILFGKVSPSGKLPVTFYHSVEELPAFEDYSMENRTYRYMKQEAQYPFGYGLSYGKINYNNLQIETGDWDKKDSIEVKAEVENLSNRKVEEVVEVYVKLSGSSLAIPNHSLVQFLRISLEPGEKKKIAFQVKKEFLQVVDHEGERKWDETDATFYLGGSQPDSISVSLMGAKPLEVCIKAEQRF
ncbi:MAG: glycoside hydrolase family 3 C-terminal domain-containing protein [Firmicutes bacterium]|nr:glycoside hydrolase family 3 C-terminal domain-containing protein [Bacillota bacterium]